MTGRSLLEHTNTIPECRQSAKCTHNLSEVVFMALCAMICGFDSWSEIALFAVTVHQPPVDKKRM